MAIKVSEELTRLLNLVPYIVAHPDVSIDKIAEDFGVSSQQIVKDLSKLWTTCGLPGYGPGDLIDISFVDDTVAIIFSAGIDRPLRLTSQEATSLLVALRALLDLGGRAEPTVVHRVMTKIETAAVLPSHAKPSGLKQVHRAKKKIRRKDIDISLQSIAEDEIGEGVPRAKILSEISYSLDHSKAIQLDYYSASTDRSSQRIIDPIAIEQYADQYYVRAYSREAKSERLFRFDRIDSIKVLEESSISPNQVVEDHTSVFSPANDLPNCVVAILPAGQWAIEQYEFTVIGKDPENSQAVRALLPYGSTDWLVRFILGFNGIITIIEPPELAELVAQQAHEALQLYELE